MKGIEQVASVLSKIQNRRLIMDFLECLLTKKEIEEISGRWELVKMLDKGWSQRRIARELRMSLCKITRGSQELKKRNSAFKRVLDEFV
jgi:TrpR family trp operon transcriptional repressor